MKIAQIAPLYESVPPVLYGGTERVVAYLCDSLSELGHDVTLFASSDARTRARLVPVRDQAIRLDACPLKSDLASHLVQLDEVRRRKEEFDILHFHLDMLHFPFFEEVAERTITTVHGRLDAKGLRETYARWPQYRTVSISDRQRLPLPEANWIATVQHGLPASLFRFSPQPRGGYLAFLGRISQEKRVDRAIALAIHAGLPLKIAAKVDAADRTYFTEKIAPLLKHPLVDFVGEIGDREKSDFLGGALALLFPIDWPEPFGLVMIEAMACGTPVIAWDCGSVPEVIDDGITGMIVRSEEEAMVALHKVPLLNRLRIRRTFERRFSAAAMARRYLGVYAKQIGAVEYEEPLKDAV